MLKVKPPITVIAKGAPILPTYSSFPRASGSIAIIVVIIILVFVIPVFQDMFADFGQDLPMPTQIVIKMSDVVKTKIHWILISMGLFIYGFKRFYSTEKGTEIIDDVALKLPIFGDLLRKVAVAKFTRTMGTMLSSGVSILDALDMKTDGDGPAMPRRVAVTGCLSQRYFEALSADMPEIDFLYGLLDGDFIPGKSNLDE